MSRSTNDVTVRPAAPEEGQAIAAALGETLARSAGGSLTTLVAWSGQGAPLAGAILRTLEDEDEPEAAPALAVDSFALAPPLTGTQARRVADALVAHAEEEARARGASKCILTLGVTAHDAIRAVEGRGYHPTGRGPYRELGPGVVEYLHGYAGPEGFLMDFHRPV